MGRTNSFVDSSSLSSSLALSEVDSRTGIPTEHLAERELGRKSSNEQKVSVYPQHVAVGNDGEFLVWSMPEGESGTAPLKDLKVSPDGTEAYALTMELEMVGGFFGWLRNAIDGKPAVKRFYASESIPWRMARLIGRNPK
jgi:hypothetical protein